MDSKYSIKYEYLKGINGEMFPFVVFVENHLGEVVYSSCIYVPENRCDIPKELEEICKESPSEYLVKATVDSFVKELEEQLPA